MSAATMTAFDGAHPIVTHDHGAVMAPTSLHVRYEARIGDFVSAFSDCYWRGFWRRRSLVTIALAEACIALAVDEWAEVGSVAFVAGFTSASILLSLAFSVVTAKVAAWRSYRHHVQIPGGVALMVNADALTTTTGSSQTRVPWSGLTGWRETPRVILLYRADVLYQFIPKRALDEAGLSMLRAFARDAGLATRPLRRGQQREIEGVAEVPLAA